MKIYILCNFNEIDADAFSSHLRCSKGLRKGR